MSLVVRLAGCWHIVNDKRIEAGNHEQRGDQPCEDAADDGAA
jgi:hypothetical protein